MGGFGFFVMIIFWGLVIWGIVALIQSVAKNNTQSAGGSQGDTALEIVRKRYARGEITKAEFDQTKKDLAL